MLLQNWDGEFDKFWPKHPKVSKIFPLMGSFWAKYLLFEIKKCRGVIFHATKDWCKIWRGTDLLLQNWYVEFDKFWLEHSKFLNMFALMSSYWAKYRGAIFHDTEDWCKVWKKIQKLTCGLENDRRNLVNFHQSTWKSQNWDFDRILLSKVRHLSKRFY